MDDAEDGKRKQLPVSLNPAARRVIESIRQNTGIPNTTAMQRILEWFAALDNKLQLAVLVRDEQTKTELTQQVIRQMAGLPAHSLAESAEKLTVEQTLAAIRAMTDRLENAHRSHVAALIEQMKAKKPTK